MDQPVIKLAHDDGVAIVTLNRAHALNAINDDIRLGLPLTLEALDLDANVRVIVIRAAGARAFSVGADVKEVRAPETSDEARKRLERTAWIEAVARLKKPVIASIHGFCLGGGLELALACDIRIASPDATFALPEVNLGLLPGGGGTQRLARLIGAGRAIDMMLTGDRIDAARAHDLGLVTRLAATSDTLAQETLTLAHALADKAPTAVRLIKQTVIGGLDLPLSAGLKLERDLFVRLLDTEDRHEAAAAFREKRPARFAGR